MYFCLHQKRNKNKQFILTFQGDFFLSTQTAKSKWNDFPSLFMPNNACITAPYLQSLGSSPRHNIPQNVVTLPWRKRWVTVSTSSPHRKHLRFRWIFLFISASMATHCSNCNKDKTSSRLFWHWDCLDCDPVIPDYLVHQ